MDKVDKSFEEYVLDFMSGLYITCKGKNIVYRNSEGKVVLVFDRLDIHIDQSIWDHLHEVYEKTCDEIDLHIREFMFNCFGFQCRYLHMDKFLSCIDDNSKFLENRNFIKE